MSITKRLFIGNLHAEVQESDLKSRFSSFGTVNNVELRSKNNDNFGFLTMEFIDIHAMGKCLDTMNNTIWKGLTLRVQYAKENFLEKLKRERDHGLEEQGGSCGISATATTTVNTSNTYERQSLHRFEKLTPTDNYDFEIVPTNTNTGSCKHAKSSVLHSSPPKLNCYDKLDMQGTHPKSAVDTHEISLKSRNPIAVANTSSPTKKSKSSVRKKKKRHNSSSSDDSSGNEKEGIPRFGGLAAYADSFPSVVAAPEGELFVENAEIGVTPSEISKPSSTFAASISTGCTKVSEFKLKLNLHKKSKSDELRVKSLSAREEETTKRSNLIRSALSNVNIPPPIVEASNSIKEKESKDLLFANDADEDGKEAEVTFTVKPQYEGISGQKLLKLKSSYGNDERFQLDQRFADDKEKEVKSVENLEKEAQLGILKEIIGPIAPTLPKSKSKSESKFDIEELKSIRFDPTLPEHQKYILKRKPLEDETLEEKRKQSEAETNKEKKKRKVEDEKAIEEERANLKDPGAKSTFKVAENLKSLFATNEVTPFSILTSFGDRAAENDEGNESPKMSKHEMSNSKSREDWRKNPFKYDSSDNEGEAPVKTKRIKTITGNSSIKSEALKNTKNDFFKKDKLFFDSKDSRLTLIFKQFLSTTENLDEVTQAFNDGGRNELKVIARSKLKNSKRKIEKKVKMTRLHRRKKKREALQKQQNYEKRKEIKTQ